MTGMEGRHGILKSDFNAQSLRVSAASVRVDDLVQRDTCLLKADVEGYEPQVMQTAQSLLSTRNVSVNVLFEHAAVTGCSDAETLAAWTDDVNAACCEQVRGPLIALER